MLDAQHAYGPDDTRIVAFDEIAFGRNLYRSLPEDVYDTGPLTGGGGRFRLVADVRLDNRAELAERLGLGGAIGHRSDASMLLAAYERWSDDFLHFTLGDYAVAVWNADTRRLLLARDHLGQRPLFYHVGSDFFAFSSMPKGLHALPTVAREPDRVRLAEFVAGVHHSGPRSFFKDVSRVEPGHAVVFDGAAVRSRRWWNPERRELRLRRFEDYRDAFRGELDRAVACRLRGGGDLVAAHLSSGWDSGAVTATAARLLKPRGGNVLALTSVPRSGNATGAPFERIADEGPLAALTASMHPNIDHVRVPGAGASPIARLSPLLELFDRPQINLCNEEWLGRIRTEAVARGARVLLTGEVGNWTISAAPSSLLADLVREGRWTDWFREARAKIRQGDARYRGVLASSFGPWLPSAIWRRVEDLSAAGSAAGHNALGAARRTKVERAGADAGDPSSRPPRNSFAEVPRGLATYDFGQFRKGALAGWGLDERDPTGDRRLTEFCMSLPIDMLLKNGVRRPLARAALSDRLPPAVLAERSKGYQAADWHEGLTRDLRAVSELVDEIASDAEAASIIDVDALRAWIAAWPKDGWERLPIMARYRSALLPALSAGHFMGRVRA